MRETTAVGADSDPPGWVHPEVFEGSPPRCYCGLVVHATVATTHRLRQKQRCPAEGCVVGAQSIRVVVLLHIDHLGILEHLVQGICCTLAFFTFIFPGAGEGDPTFWQLVLQALIGPVAAFFTFIGSMGNIPLAAVLLENGVSMAGIMAFIFSVTPSPYNFLILLLAASLVIFGVIVLRFLESLSPGER